MDKRDFGQELWTREVATFWTLLEARTSRANTVRESAGARGTHYAIPRLGISTGALEFIGTYRGTARGYWLRRNIKAELRAQDGP